MRQYSLFLLLVTSAVPALAVPGDGNRQSRGPSQSETSDNRPQRAERTQRSERREVREPSQREMQVQRRQVGGATDAAVAAARGGGLQAQQQQVEQEQNQTARSERLQRYRQLQAQQQSEAAEAGERRSGALQRRLDGQQAIASGQLAPREGRTRSIPTTTPIVRVTPEAGQSGPTRTDVRVSRRNDRDDRNRWSSHWRNDNRYDWRRYRDRNRSIFRIGFYHDPFGYSYRRFGIGSYLYPSYYQSNFWLNDPWQYRLPPAYGPYRWVRYHNDAVLLDTWTGEVADVIYGFFW